MNEILCPHCGANQSNNIQVFHFLASNVRNYGDGVFQIVCDNIDCKKLMKMNGTRHTTISCIVHKSDGDMSDVSFPQAFSPDGRLIT